MGKNDYIKGVDGDTYDHSLQLHYRQYLVALLFADLPSLSLFIDFYTCIIRMQRRYKQGNPTKRQAPVTPQFFSGLPILYIISWHAL